MAIMNFNRKSQVYQNAFSGISGAYGEGDRGAFQSVPMNTGNPYESQNYVARWRQYCHLYEICWEARKIIRIPVEDALRKEPEFENIPEPMLGIIKKELIKLKFTESIKRAMMLERLLGGCLQFFGLESNSDDPSKRYDHRVRAEKLRFINVIPVSRISRVNWETDPLLYGYMRPSEFIINGHTVHVSRCIVWDGEPLFDPYDYALTQLITNLSGFGPSKLAPIWDDIIKAVGTRQAAYQMIQTNNSIIMAVSELQDMMGSLPGKTNVLKLKEIANSLSVFRAAIIQKDKVDITQSAASFGSVPELLMSFLQVLSAASDIPATRFLGQAPGGLNATGDSDLENYYNVIDAMQRQRIEPAYRQVINVIGFNKWPDRWEKIRNEYEIKFSPLWNINELEEAQKNQIEITNVMQCWEAGILPDEKVIEELNLKKVFSTDLDATDMDLTKGIQDDLGFYEQDQHPGGNNGQPTVPATGFSGKGQGKAKGSESATYTGDIKTPAIKKPSLPQISNKGDFKEQDHPRANDGKFGSGGGSASETEKPKKKDSTFEEKISHHTETDKKAHIEANAKGLAIPPGWTDVYINPDPEAATLATGRDTKGRKVYLRSKKAVGEAQVKKFERVKEFSKVMPGLIKKLTEDFDKSEEAKVLYLITKTGFRVGGEKDTKADVAASGASTLKSEHVSIDGNKITFDFTGKKGVRQNHTIEDDKLAGLFEERKGRKQLFGTNSVKVLKALKSAARGEYLVKDIRTHVATAEALRIVKGMEVPKTEKERKKAILVVATQVAFKLGNTPEMARDSYIAPEVFSGWEIEK